MVMPRVPVTQGPSIQQQGIGTPYASARAPAGAFGEGLARGLGDAAQVGQQIAEDEAVRWMTETLSTARQRWTKELIDRKVAAEPGAANFAGTFADDFGKFREQAIALAPSGRAREALSAKLNEMGGGLFNDAYAFEVGERSAFAVDTQRQNIDRYAQTIGLDPSQYDAIQQDQWRAIAALNAPLETKRKLLDYAREQFSRASVYGAIERDPAAAAAALGGSIGAVSAGAEQWRPQVSAAAREERVPEALAMAVLSVESAGRADAVSPAGARGLFQLMPGTASDLGVDPDVADQNIRGGVRYLGQQLKAFGGDPRAALVAYNWGPENARKWLAAGADPEKLPAETRAYVDKVLGVAGAGSAIPGIETLSVQDRVQLYGMAEREASRRGAVDRVILKSAYEDSVAFLRAGGDPAQATVNASALVAAFGPEAGGAMAAELDRAAQFGRDYRTIATATPGEIAALFEARKPTGPTGFADAARDLKALTDAYAERNRKLADDPAAFILANDPATARAVADLSAGATTWDAAAAAFDGIYDRMGVPAAARGLLSDDQARAMVKDITGGDAIAMAQKLDALRGIMSNDTFNRVYADLVTRGKLPAEAQIVTEIDQRNAGAKKAYGDALLIGAPKLKDLLPNGQKDVTAIEEGLSAALAPFRLSLGGSAAGTSVYATRAKAASLLAMQYLSTGVESDPAAAATRAANDIVNWAYDFDAEGLRIPKRADGSSMVNDVDAILRRTEETLNPDEYFLYPNDRQWLTDGTRAAVMSEADIRNAYAVEPKAWANLGDDSGLVLTFSASGQPVRLKDGSPIIVRFGDIVPGAAQTIAVETRRQYEGRMSAPLAGSEQIKIDPETGIITRQK